MREVTPVTLEGGTVRLEPMRAEHLASLFDAAQSDDIWAYLPVGRPHTPEEMRRWFETAEEARRSGAQLPFTVFERTSGKAIGSTRYMAISPQDASLEIGHTWLGRQYWRTAVNTESKYLLLRHAFETLGCVRVWFKSDARNVNSHRAIERLGAKREGVLRKHMRVKDGFHRDSVIFSILAEEWPEARVRLEERLGLARAPSQT
jgi:RimJ/RimL family protein N-acetyltransferase